MLKCSTCRKRNVIHTIFEFRMLVFQLPTDLQLDKRAKNIVFEAMV